MDTPHHHAQVDGVGDDPDPLGPENVPDRLGDLLGQPFLHLESPGKNIDDARNLRESDDPPIGDVGDVHLPVEGQHVVFAQAVELDVLDQHHLRAVLLEHPLADDLADGLPVAGRQLGQAARNAIGGALEPLPSGVLAQAEKELTNQVRSAQLFEPRYSTMLLRLSQSLILCSRHPSKRSISGSI